MRSETPREMGLAPASFPLGGSHAALTEWRTCTGARVASATDADRLSVVPSLQGTLPMEEPADIYPLLRRRRSSRSMDPERPVDAAWVRRLLEAARWAPSSGNGQPWRYIVFDQRVPEALERARACLSPGNQAWARQAPTLILAVAKQTRDDGATNTKAEHDLGLANMCLLLQAVALGLHCRPMGGFDAQAARLAFHIPAGHAPLVMIAVGHPGDVSVLPPDLIEKERGPRRRKPLDDLAFLGEWDAPGAADG